MVTHRTPVTSSLQAHNTTTKATEIKDLPHIHDFGLWGGTQRTPREPTQAQGEHATPYRKDKTEKRQINPLHLQFVVSSRQMCYFLSHAWQKEYNALSVLDHF